MKLVGALLFVLAGTAAAVEPVGPNFRVNTTTEDTQTYPAVASTAGGNYIVVWFQPGTGIVGQRLSSAGTRIGAEFTLGFVNQSSAVAAGAAGGAAVSTGSTLTSNGIYARRLDATGLPIGSPFQVNQYGWDPAVAVDPSGGFVVVWRMFFSGQDVFGRRYDATGTPVGSEFQVNTYTTADQGNPAVASDAAGNFVVVWDSEGQDGQGYGIFAQRFDSAGVPQGAEFQVHSTTGFQRHSRHPSVARSATGDFVVVWSYGHFLGEGEPRGQRFDAAGVPQGAEFALATQPTMALGPRVAMDAAGAFVAAWRPKTFGVPPNDILARVFASDGTPQGAELAVNANELLIRRHPAITAGGTGKFLVAWSDEIGNDIVGQRLSATCGDGTVDPGEACDDGNDTSGDGCAPSCRAEPCFACVGAPSSCTPIATCTAGDGCCAPGCTTATDADCPTLISGATLLIRNVRDDHDLVSFLSRDALVDTTGVDPVADGAIVHVYNAAGGEQSECIELANEGGAAWRLKNTSPTGPVYAYSNPNADYFNRCKAARMRGGKQLSVRCPQARYGLEGTQGSVGVRFLSGNREFCASMSGASVVRDNELFFVARGAPAPAACPASPLPCPLEFPLAP